MSSMSGGLGLVEAVAGAAARRAAKFAGAVALMAVVAACGARNATDAAPRGATTAPDARVEAPAPEIGRAVAVDPTSGRAIIAVLAPTGAANAGVAQIGEAIANAAVLAAEDIADPALVIRVYDTSGTPEGAKRAAETAVADGAALILGPLFGRSVGAVQPVAEEAGLAVIAFSTDATVAGGNVFLSGILLETEIDRVLGYASARGVSTLGALAPETLQGEVAVRAIRLSAARYGVEVIAIDRYVQDFKGIEEAARRYAAAHSEAASFGPIDAVFLPDSGQALQSVAAYLAYFDVSPAETRFLGAGIWNGPSTLKEVALRGGWFAAPDPGPREAFAERYVAAYGARPHALAALGYDAVAATGAMLADARARRERYPFTIASITAPAGFVGVNGVYRFRRDGLNDRGLAVLEVRQDGFVVIDAAPTSFVGY